MKASVAEKEKLGSITSFVLLLTSVSLAACTSAPKKSPPTRAQLESANTGATSQKTLSHEEAQNRFKQVAHVTYGLWFGLDRENADFEGRTSINFELKQKAKDHGKSLFLDFSDGNLKSIRVNGQNIEQLSEHYDGSRIIFSLSELQDGTNRIEIAYTHPYSTNGHGLFRYKDPADGAIYLYSDSEPDFAHRIFPCFDQPDLKAAFELTVAAPEDWTVVSNTLERDNNVVDGRKVWVFPTTPLLSTYVFALIAGDYDSWKADANGIPLRLLARKSIHKYVDAPEIFEITRKGLDFYSTKFGYPFPYSKYDQIFVPDFNEGGMENAAAVTLTEQMAFRTKVSQRTHLYRAELILHEMAHQWFGDLVTMKWWNGLWLNESFADFMAAWAVDQATSYKGVWSLFFSHEKSSAYYQDSLNTTHPIDVPIADTEHAFSNFDAITYGKGAAIIRQLQHFIGEDDFNEGVQRYFLKYALRNSTLHEFMKVLAEASGKDLKRWQELWLLTPGANTVQADWSCNEEGKISKFDLLQGNASESKVLRPHHTEIGLFYEIGGKFVSELRSTNRRKKEDSKTLQVTYSSEKTPVEEALGRPCPAFVYPNLNDADYVQVILDPISLKKVTEDIKRFSDPFMRQMIWASLWESVMEGKLSARVFVEAALKNLKFERDLAVLKQVVDRLIPGTLTKNSALRLIAPSERTGLYDSLETSYLQNLEVATPGSDAQLLWFRSFLDTAHSAHSIDFIKKLLKIRTTYRGLKIDQEVRWSLLEAWARSGFEGAPELVEKEKLNDPSDFGALHAVSALALIPTEKNKHDWLEKIILAGKSGGSTHELSNAKVKAIMRSMSMLGQESVTESWADQYFGYLPEAIHSSNEEFAEAYVHSLYPGLCNGKTIELTRNSLSQNPPPIVEKSLKTHLQEEERCIHSRTLNQALITSSTGQ